MSTLELAPALAQPIAVRGANAVPRPAHLSYPPAVTFSTTPRLRICQANIDLQHHLFGGKSESVLQLEMGRHSGLLYPQGNVDTEFSSSKTPISRNYTRSVLPGSGSAFHILPVLATCSSIHNLCENVGLGIYCHGALSALGIFFQKPSHILCPYPGCFCCSKREALVLTDGWCPRPRGHVPEREAAMLRLG